MRSVEWYPSSDSFTCNKQRASRHNMLSSKICQGSRPSIDQAKFPANLQVLMPSHYMRIGVDRRWQLPKLLSLREPSGGHHLCEATCEKASPLTGSLPYTASEHRTFRPKMTADLLNHCSPGRPTRCRTKHGWREACQGTSTSHATSSQLPAEWLASALLTSANVV